MQLLPLISALSAAALLFLLRLHQRIHWEGQTMAGTCEVVTLDEDRSQPWRTVNRQSVRCACGTGQMAGTVRARPACVDEGVVRTQQWCEMSPCLEDEVCHLLDHQSGWICTQPGGESRPPQCPDRITDEGFARVGGDKLPGERGTTLCSSNLTLKKLRGMRLNFSTRGPRNILKFDRRAEPSFKVSKMNRAKADVLCECSGGNTLYHSLILTLQDQGKKYSYRL